MLNLYDKDILERFCIEEEIKKSIHHDVEKILFNHKDDINNSILKAPIDSRCIHIVSDTLRRKLMNLINDSNYKANKGFIADAVVDSLSAHHINSSYLRCGTNQILDIYELIIDLKAVLHECGISN